jgi:hypothetical protein
LGDGQKSLVFLSHQKLGKFVIFTIKDGLKSGFHYEAWGETDVNPLMI